MEKTTEGITKGMTLKEFNEQYRIEISSLISREASWDGEHLKPINETISYLENQDYYVVERDLGDDVFHIESTVESYALKVIKEKFNIIDWNLEE